MFARELFFFWLTYSCKRASSSVPAGCYLEEEDAHLGWVPWWRSPWPGSFMFMIFYCDLTHIVLYFKNGRFLSGQDGPSRGSRSHPWRTWSESEDAEEGEWDCFGVFYSPQMSKKVHRSALCLYIHRCPSGRLWADYTSFQAKELPSCDALCKDPTGSQQACSCCSARGQKGQVHTWHTCNIMQLCI